jgi:hypothetical protein
VADPEAELQAPDHLEPAAADLLDQRAVPPGREGEIHRVDPDFGPTLTASNRDSQSNCWVNWKIMGQSCEFQVVGGTVI